ncbi:MAG TPA: TatD family hydrolase [Candidatus Nitrosocosmicus sp.]|nr:TatD family hydrolase [Candidatus Nitrosocosmicus sp.]
MIVDSHCHLHDAAFADTRAMLSRAMASDVWGVVAVGCDPATNARTLAAADGHRKSIWAALGFHPEWEALTDADLEQVEAQIAEHHGRIVAVGEIGLPWYNLTTAADAAGRSAQGRARLGRLLRLATRFDLPVVLHAPHGAAADALEELRRAKVERAVFHWHKAPMDVTRAIVDAGHFVSVTPEVVYRERDRELVEAVPLDSLLVESDGPWQYGGEFESERSGPWVAARVAEEVAKIKRLPVDETMYRLSVNVCRLFDLVWA